MLRIACIALIAAALNAQTLDYEVFKARIQPIFLAKRGDHARCYPCHSSATNFRLQRLSPGAQAWDEEQSRKNFAAVERLVVAGNPLASRLLTHPLAHEAGGDEFHSGGKHWDAQTDPEVKTLIDWIRAAK
jgi:hypothetical protein